MSGSDDYMGPSPTNYRDLPADCLLRIIALLRLSDVSALLRTSRHWNSAITDNEEAIYHQLAKSCDSMDVPIGSLEDALKSWASPEARKVQSWKQYCQLQVVTNRRWHGKEKAYTSLDVFGYAQQTQVDLVKIDTEKSLVVMMGRSDNDGCLVVHCLRDPTQKALFRINQVSDHARVELSAGIVVFTRGTGSDLLEVWRWAEDQAVNPLEREPTEQQLNMYENAVKAAGFQAGPSHRGELIPIGVLKNPAKLRVVRLVYPTLCVGSQAGDQLWLWDVQTRTLTQTINIEPSPYQAYKMLYVDFNETHVFVGTNTVSVYSRTTGECIFQLQEAHFEQIASCVDPTTRSDHNLPRPSRTAPCFTRYWLPEYYPYRRLIMHLEPRDIVKAVRVSPNGDSFVAVTYYGYIIHIKGLKSVDEEAVRNTSGDTPSVLPATRPSAKERMPPSLDNFRISVIQVGLLGRLRDLAYDGNKILTYGGSGLYLLHLHGRTDYIFRPVVVFDDDIPSLELHPFPSKVLYVVPPFGDKRNNYYDCSCLQMTQDSCWIAWSHQRSRQYGEEQKTVAMIDFARASPDS